MDRQEVMNCLSDIWPPAQVSALSGSWSFHIESEPQRVVTINKKWAENATAAQLDAMLKGTSGGDFLIDRNGKLLGPAPVGR